MENDQEIWKDIPGYCGYYQVSNLGRARSVDRVVYRKFNHNVYGKMFYKGQLLKIGKFKTGYSRINLKKDGKSKSAVFSRIVWEAFNGPIPDGMEINHLDENKERNCLSNLSLMTPKENSNWGTRNKRISEKLTGLKKGPMADSHKKKISEGNKNSEKAKKARKQNAIKLYKKVAQYDLSGNFIKEYDSELIASDKTGICYAAINMCACGHRQTAGGFIWKKVSNC